LRWIEIEEGLVESMEDAMQFAGDWCHNMSEVVFGTYACLGVENTNGSNSSFRFKVKFTPDQRE
jgi:hypothetical protein